MLIHMKRTAGQQGFTLVELAISLTIIGLLVGGILKGRELVDNASATRVVRQVQAYKAAVLSFRDAYGELPGDLLDPGTRLPNCGAAPCNVAGNADKIVGTTIAAVNSGTISNPQNTENFRFWLNLAVTKMITGIDEVGTVATTGVCGATCGDFGYNYPASIEGGGMQIINVNAAAGTYPAVRGHFLWLTSNPSTTTPYLLPHIVSLIDRKGDDGLPFRGDILSTPGTGTTCYTGTAYNEGAPQRDCGAAIFLTE